MVRTYRYILQILLILVCAFHLEIRTSSAQTGTLPDKLLGLTFGSTVAECEKIIKANKGKVMVKLTNEYLYKKGIEVGTDTAYTVLLKFNKNKLYGFTMTFKPDYWLYLKIHDIISEKYIKPMSEESLFMPPFKRGDGKEEQAVISSKAKIWSVGLFLILIILILKLKISP
ncbi:MAG: hypothetical protein HYZ42_11070 [Bacteroidetes bacterium]|nr:hypothetical protein [Bacteroidota bacterium]